ncbi:plasmid pRiA4b ORF-3 family protein [Sporolactobacillus sp. CPB3-1]|uniref:Plasmid pRiA4b ORF-3 family protein n=1 Tax=Sporolactobacillus mangiferae TaxID=2940498 RepID=A0ABT0MB68_9BACL|nr:plasmid pRiA4b ORF-3 family protein [Sporolactobacillus mangiferae]MCL1631928.1 plasmid pRiA4b ORF-3 family protein [Sporolactobacillus mangiferae]
MASHPIYQFYAELADYEPKIWRRFQVMNNVGMAKLGYIMMTLFEMQASHLFCFNVPMAANFRKCVKKHINNNTNGKVIDLFAERSDLTRLRIELPSEDDFSEFEGRTLDAAETKVKNVLTEETETITFSYDYGDGWEVHMVLEKIVEDKDLPGKELPRVLEGDGYGIIEDCGGPGGLEDIADAFNKKKGPEYRQYCEWLGVQDMDLSSFDIGDMNYRLKKVPRIYSDIYEYGLEPTRRSMDLLMRNYKK